MHVVDTLEKSEGFTEGGMECDGFILLRIDNIVP